MIKFLDLKTFSKGLSPVTSTEYFIRTGEYHPDGLFSERIFGPIESLERKQQFSYINLNAYVVHPTAFQVLKRLDKKIEKFISTEESFSLDEKGILILDENGVTGILEFINLFPKIYFRTDTEVREKLSIVLKREYKLNTVFIDKIPVIPPDYRPIYYNEQNELMEDRLNEYYITILRRSFQVKTSGVKGVLFDLLNYELQKSVLEHDKFIRSLIEKKSGLIRSQLLGKRTDFSGRAVITPGSGLKINELGVPLRMAVLLFEPFIIHYLLYSKKVDTKILNQEIQNFYNIPLSVDSLKRVLKAIKTDDEIPEILYNIIFEAAEIVSYTRVVIAKRDPVLHAEGVRAFKPKIHKGSTILLPPLQVGGFNADFDGDSMAIFHPLTRQAQDEAKMKMLNIEGRDTIDSIVFALSKEMCVGLYAITKDFLIKNSHISITDEDIENANDPTIAVIYRGQKTTMGKAILNSCFPPDFPFIDKQVNKSFLNNLISKVSDKYGQKITIDIYNKLEKFGFKFATIMASTFTLDNLKLPTEIYELKTKLENASTEEAAELIDQMKKILIKHLENTGLYDLVESGAGKGWDQPTQILIAKGIISDPEGNILPVIKGSFSDGLSTEEYFQSSYGARRGIIDRVLNTADTGYMSRKLAYVLNTVEVDRQLRDCKVQKYLNIRLTEVLKNRLRGRYVLEDNRIQLFDPNTYKVGDVIHLRSPIYCQSPKICHICYGKLVERHRTPYIGILAAQVIGEIGTQLIMQTFHTGGAVKLIEKNMIEDIIQNDPLISKSIIEKYLFQEGNKLVCKQQCKVILSFDYYKLDDNLIYIDEEGVLQAQSIIAIIEFEDVMFNIILDYAINIQAVNMIINKKENITLEFSPDSIILETNLEAQELKGQIQYVERLLGGRELVKDPDHLFTKLFRVYGEKRNIDIVHLEVLLSQCLRDRRKPNLPARLGKPWDPITMNIKNMVFNTGFMQGLAFENIGKAITTGLITEDSLDSSILEKVLTGQLTEEK